MTDDEVDTHGWYDEDCCCEGDFEDDGPDDMMDCGCCSCCGCMCDDAWVYDRAQQEIDEGA